MWLDTTLARHQSWCVQREEQIAWSLSKSVSDADDDIASVRWLVDGVLLEDGTDELHFTRGHELTLIVRDERGATTTDVQIVSCQ